jgi:transcriptional regulator
VARTRRVVDDGVVDDAGLYVPHFNQMADEAVRAFVDGVGTAHLVTVGPEGAPDSTWLPILWLGDRVEAHLARANPHWRRMVDGGPALLVVAGRDHYVSPSWYPSKAEHGRAVPTWNYSVVHLRGTVRLRQDREWLHDHVTRLSDRHEEHRADRWRVTDAPTGYIDKSLRPIIGIEVTVTDVRAKAKLIQNRDEADRLGVADGLRAEGVDPDGLVEL